MWWSRIMHVIIMKLFIFYFLCSKLRRFLLVSRLKQFPVRHHVSRFVLMRFFTRLWIWNFPLQLGKHLICFVKWLTRHCPLSPSASAPLGASMSDPGHAGCRQWHHAVLQLRGRYSHTVLLLGEAGRAAQAAAQRHARYYKQPGRRSSFLPHLRW